ncbi:MAG: orotate phosphoribosyltransferase [Coxiellaceae bacterium]|nr:orotate phosphoribosyltransferase [Coxiellaceae bacterium]
MPTESQIAKILLDINAISIKPNEPFRYASGMLSPIYCDNRLVISYPEQRQQIIEAFIDSIIEHADAFDVVAGTATAGIPHAAWIADRLNKPMVYVRSSSKGHGKNNQIEGLLKPDQTAIVIEDLISTGGSAINATDALREAGANVSHCFAIFTYNFANAEQNFNDKKLSYHSLTNFDAVMECAEKNGQLNHEQRQLVQQWNQAPNDWENLYNAREKT